MSASVAPDGVTVRVFASVVLPCTRRISAFQEFAATGRVGPDGRLRLEGRSRDNFYATERTGLKGPVSLDLGFDGAGASGTFDASVRIRVGKRRVTCKESFSPQLRAAPRDVSAPAPAPPGALLLGTGETLLRSTGVPVGFRVSSTGRRTSIVSVGIPLACRGGDFTDYLQNFSPPFRIAEDGTFRLRERFTERYRRGGAAPDHRADRRALHRPRRVGDLLGAVRLPPARPPRDPLRERLDPLQRDPVRPSGAPISHRGSDVRELDPIGACVVPAIDRRLQHRERVAEAEAGVAVPVR